MTIDKRSDDTSSNSVGSDRVEGEVESDEPNPLLILGTMDVMGDFCIGPPCPFCAVCGSDIDPNHRVVCYGDNYCWMKR